MTLKEIRMEITTDSSGDAVVYGSPSVVAKLIGVIFDSGDMDTGADYTLTTDQYPVVETIFYIENGGTSDLIWYPRHLSQTDTGGDRTDTAGASRVPPLMLGRPKLTVAQGGNKKSGAWILVLEE